MKTGIHPTIHQTKISCSGCNTQYTIGSTLEELKIEICMNCHPHYTGKEKLMDSEGRVEQFMKKFKDAGEEKKAA